MKQERTTAQTNVESDSIRGRTELLISAALSLTHTIELLSNAELMGDLRPDVRRGVDFYEEVTRFEVLLIEDAMRVARGNQVQAAELLRLNHTTLNSKIKRYKINPRVFASYASIDSDNELERPKFYGGTTVNDRAPSAPA